VEARAYAGVRVGAHTVDRAVDGLQDKRSDTCAARFTGDSVEVDAIPAPTLRQIVRDAIEQHIDQDMLRRTRQVERSERDILQHWREDLA
jgi:hypothetical protein